MDKNAIKKFAVWARRELITRVSQRAVQYEITENGYGDYNAESVNGRIMSPSEKSQRKALIDRIRNKGYEQVMEEVAYTWFNRFSALRFMEVNGYLPSRVRVFTDDDNNFKPQIITDAIDLNIHGLDMEKVYELKDDATKEEELYKYLLITQCNALSAILPKMFQKISDYTELLFPDNLLHEGSVIQQMIEMIPEEDWQDAVQIIGWLYQYYNSEKKDEVFAALKKNVKITKDNIPAATQLFTPDWIVRYMVENSLGRLWVEGHPNDELKSNWKYYIEEAEQEPNVQSQLTEIRKEYANLKPEDIKVIDPCCGSGHILAYLFDVLMQIYDAYGYTTREAVDSIVTNNIYGLDIDERAAQLAYFTVMMQARKYDSRFLKRTDDEGNPRVPQPHVYEILESNHIDAYVVDEFVGDNVGLKKVMDTILSEMHDAKEYGSILTITPQDWSAIYARFNEYSNSGQISMYTKSITEELLPIVQIAEVLAQKYDTVVTNPPYMSAGNMNAKLTNFIKKNYVDYKSDFFSTFVVKCSNMAKKHSYCSFLTPYVWMFIQSYKKMREYLYANTTIETLIQFEYSAFEEATVPICTFVFRNGHIAKKGCYLRLTDFKGGMEVQRQKTLEAIENHECGFFFEQNSDNFSKIPGSPVAYWVGENVISAFANGRTLVSVARTRQGLATTNNNLFLRLWYEVDIKKVGFGYANSETALESKKKWFPVNKGGGFRRWYGNNEYLVNYEYGGKTICDYIDNTPGVTVKSNGRVINREFYFQGGMTWGTVTSGNLSMRHSHIGFIPEHAGGMIPLIQWTNREKYLLGLMNSNTTMLFLSFLSPTLRFTEGPVGLVPVIIKEEYFELIGKLVDKCEDISILDWDSFETSWDFKQHPLLTHSVSAAVDVDKKHTNHWLIENDFNYWCDICEARFNQLKANEEELNRIFIDIYGLQDELTPEVEDKDVTVRKADLQRDIKSFVSYAVGCMFGRYSLDVEGLAYAGGEWVTSKYQTFKVDSNNIIPICDDEYFEDDIVCRFIEFVKTVYGADTLDENLKFIANALGGSGQPKEVIRNYFIKDFYADHCKMYQKKPIYWLFDSGKKNGFKALIYMHRYQQDTIARMRTDYVHEQQARYRTALGDLEQRINGTSGSEKVKLDKQMTKLRAQIEEIGDYEEKIHHLADQMISIDLDDGVKHNYEIFKDVLAKIK